jgi:hypothetical protein
MPYQGDVKVLVLRTSELFTTMNGDGSEQQGQSEKRFRWESGETNRS